MDQLKFFVPTLFGLEGLAADELRRLSLADVRAGKRPCAVYRPGLGTFPAST